MPIPDPALALGMPVPSMPANISSIFLLLSTAELLPNVAKGFESSPPVGMLLAGTELVLDGAGCAKIPAATD